MARRKVTETDPMIRAVPTEVSYDNTTTTESYNKLSEDSELPARPNVEKPEGFTYVTPKENRVVFDGKKQYELKKYIQIAIPDHLVIILDNAGILIW